MPFKVRLSAAVAALVATQAFANSPSEPPNSVCEVSLGTSQPTLQITYEGRVLFSGVVGIAREPHSWKDIGFKTTVDKGTRGELTQRIILTTQTGKQVTLKGKVTTSDEGFPAETASPAQDRFKLVRNSVGLSANLRNNAIYDRRRDWMVEGEGDGVTSITPNRPDHDGNSFEWSASGAEITLTFRPKFYQLHKNLPYFKPWDYDVWKGSVTGWCSWWAFETDIREKDVEKISEIFAEKLRDFGYDYIQIDDGYQSSGGGLPKDWLTTNDHFPSGLDHLSKSISSKGLKPALWLNVHFGDSKFVTSHPDWFIKDADGKPHKGPWIDYGLDGSNRTAVDSVVRPTYSAVHAMGWQYVKVDALRHLLYDASYPSKDYFAHKGVKLEDAFRDYLHVIREEVGPNTYMLSCWGVLPETIGIANACRLGGDGFGPSTLQQYTSWNNVVWRNDPDHCDIKPFDHSTNKTQDGYERIRPVLVSMAGAQLLLSDKPAVYENDANLEGVKRSSPIMFTLPGQLYDYDPVKTEHLKQGLRNDKGGAPSGPIDADQTGEVCPWWMLDINRPFESWTVLTHMNWSKEPMSQSSVKFHDLGLSDSTYSVFEFWSKRYLGDFRGEFLVSALDPLGLSVYSIRKTLDRPQILSTSRHITQGGVDLENLSWNGHERVLTGASHVVRNDSYSLYIRLPDGIDVKEASFGRRKAEIRVDDHLAEIKILPDGTKTLSWRVEFQHRA